MRPLKSLSVTLGRVTPDVKRLTWARQNSELMAVPERNLHEVPDAVSDEEAVFVEPLAAAFQVVKQCPVE